MKEDPENVTVSAWYEIGVKDCSTLVVRVHQKAISHLCSLRLDKSPIVKGFQEAYDLGLFRTPDKGNWGFGEALKLTEPKYPNWLEYDCSLPVFCGNERGATAQFRDLVLRSTLSILFQGLWLFDGETDCGFPQLIVIDGLRVYQGLYGGAISATLTPTISRWLSSLSDNSSLIEVEEAMVQADAHMWPDQKFTLHRTLFRAWFRSPKWINLSVPGDACGLDPSDYYHESLDQGFKLSPHNTDSGLQQLTLLMGLAKLHDLVQ